MSEHVEIEYLLTVQTEMSFQELRKLEITGIRVLSVVKRICGSETLDKMLIKTQQSIMALRSLQVALHALEVASGPIGWAYAITSLIATGVVASDAFLDIGAGT